MVVAASDPVHAHAARGGAAAGRRGRDVADPGGAGRAAHLRDAPRRVTATRAFTVRGRIRPVRGAVALVIARQGHDGEFHTVARVPVRTAAGTFRTRVRL